MDELLFQVQSVQDNCQNSGETKTSYLERQISKCLKSRYILLKSMAIFFKFTLVVS